MGQAGRGRGGRDFQPGRIIDLSRPLAGLDTLSKPAKALFPNQYRWHWRHKSGEKAGRPVQTSNQAAHSLKTLSNKTGQV
jgi:hypothetical protein